LQQQSKNIIHIIDSLGSGGAEILLMNTIALLPEYAHVVIYLHEPDELKNTALPNVKYINLHHSGLSDLLKTVGKIRKEIALHDPFVVHSHLIASCMMARMAVPKSIPLVTTLHSELGRDAFAKNRLSLLVEKLTLKKRHTLVAVSKYVLKDYLNHVSFRGKSFVLYNFLPDLFFSNPARSSTTGTLRCVAVGNLKEAKNYPYLLEIFKHLKKENIHLDIYGDGHLESILQEKINRDQLPVTLKGQNNDPKAFLENYDLFIQASQHEGFGLSVIEAMAAKLPLFLSAIPVFREITDCKAHFFPLNNAAAASEMLKGLRDIKETREKFIEPAYQYCSAQYNGATYKQNLLDIYKQVRP
jgi:glycosyltransferase involved in cell wall biosynthesis